jgi:hypothetical protein
MHSAMPARSSQQGDDALQQRLRQLEEEFQDRLNQLRDEASSQSSESKPSTTDNTNEANGQIALEGFEVFKGRWQPASRSIPRVALQRRGNFSLNRAAFQALGQPKTIVFAYNPTRREIAITAAPPNLNYASPVRKQAATESYLVSATAFVGSIGIGHDDAILVFDSVDVRDGGVLILHVDDARKAPTRNRSKKGGIESGQ